MKLVAINWAAPQPANREAPQHGRFLYAERGWGKEVVIKRKK